MLGKKRMIVVVEVFLVIVVILVLTSIFCTGDKSQYVDMSDDYLQTELDIKFFPYAKIINETSLYDYFGVEVGKIGKGVEVSLEETDISLTGGYFKLKGFDSEYYVYYGDVEEIDSVSLNSDRYTNYIVFNQNIITSDKTSFYDEFDNLVYEFDKSFDLPIYVLDDDKYGVELNNRLLYVKNDDVLLKKDNHNTDKVNASGVGVLNYHFFYDDFVKEEIEDCTTVICHSKSQFKEQLDFIKENNIFSITMNELEMYIDGKIQLPKSVLITIDDGGKTKLAVDMLTDYKMYGTIFLITSWYNPSEYYKTDYIELHSHTHNLHDSGYCPGGQGGGLKCLSEEVILSDLSASREALGGATALCYPFYEYNDYTIELAKKAGFTMGFAGESTFGDNLVHVGDDKFRLKRFVIVNYTTIEDLKNYFGQIK